MQQLLYILGLAFQFLGFIITAQVAVLFFSDMGMGPLMERTFLGIVVFFLGWLMIKYQERF
ncbi:MAG: hypothetical protein HY731_05800 [Candidatus Tectomicrobia bacterium]|nr:hypothetical protein [Candidatus Tectomicrobia bacterium]